MCLFSHSFIIFFKIFGQASFAAFLIVKKPRSPGTRMNGAKNLIAFLLKSDEFADSSGFWVLKNLVWGPLLNGR